MRIADAIELGHRVEDIVNAAHGVISGPKVAAEVYRRWLTTIRETTTNEILNVLVERGLIAKAGLGRYGGFIALRHLK